MANSNNKAKGETICENIKAKAFGIDFLVSEDEQKVVDVLYNYKKEKGFFKLDLKQKGFVVNSLDEIDCNKRKDYITFFDIIDRYKNCPKELENLLNLMPDISAMKSLVDKRYSYDFLINILFPNYDKKEYIDKMLEKGYTDDEIKYCLENNIFLQNYHNNFDYLFINDVIYKCKDYILPEHDKNHFYYLEHGVLLILLNAFNEIQTVEVAASLGKNLDGYYRGVNRVLSLCIKKDFTYEEIILFIPILSQFVNTNKVNKLILFLKVSTKDELFKKIFDI